MDIDGTDGRQLVRQLKGEAGLQQPAPPPGNDVDRRTIGTTSAARRHVIVRHTWFVS
jgi:DNA primase